eukprot:gnl/TRDRNA2_/TRDRNA2_152754_c0_seq1.p1 gnl/TRDRNA2_/TRDRNA2_152754_c0~~gnl/TRDRNA2_/TRDRNA2_152754_c0_seq1.p1  ORF type:complete len:214 (-),score=33.94 gnl/TRDRNA2_/TRDRNA2_152754_c0_seq1:40-681(-)
MGRPNSGKSTMLRILGSVALPQPGGYFIPSHLRALHVDAESYFFKGSLFENLVFGVAPGNPDGSIERVSFICKALALTSQTIEIVEQGMAGDVRDWDTVLSHTQRNLCMLVRALIANPELLVVHKPTMYYDEKITTKVFKTLSEFVRKKGVCQDLRTKYKRRPRTVIMTTSKVAGLEMADRVYEVTTESGGLALKEIDFHSMSQADLFRRISN